MITEHESNDADRREHVRHSARLALSIDAGARKDRFGVAQNASAGGILFNTPSRFQPDEELVLTILFTTRPAMQVKARVVRIEATTSGPWRYLAAARFDAPKPELGDLLTTGVDSS